MADPLENRIEQRAPEVDLEPGAKMDQPGAHAQPRVADPARMALPARRAQVEAWAGEPGVEVPRRQRRSGREPRGDREPRAQGMGVLEAGERRHEIDFAAVVQDPRGAGAGAGEDAVVELVTLDLQVVVEQ